MHKIWQKIEPMVVNSSSINLAVGAFIKLNNNFILYIWGGTVKNCKPKETKPFKEISKYNEYEVYIHRILTEDSTDKYKKYAKNYLETDPPTLSRCFSKQDFIDLGIFNYFKYATSNGIIKYDDDNIYKLEFFPKESLEELYDILLDNKSNIKSYGGNCKSCGLFDGYASADKNGDYFCYKHFYKD